MHSTYRMVTPSDIAPSTTLEDPTTRARCERLAPLLSRTADALIGWAEAASAEMFGAMPEGEWESWGEAEQDAWTRQQRVSEALWSRARMAEDASTSAWDVADGVWY